MKQIICSDCQGSGKIQVSSDGFDEMVVCDTCNGYGSIFAVPIDNRITFDGDKTDISDPSGKQKFSHTLENMCVKEVFDLLKKWFR